MFTSVSLLKILFWIPIWVFNIMSKFFKTKSLMIWPLSIFFHHCPHQPFLHSNLNCELQCQHVLVLFSSLDIYTFLPSARHALTSCWWCTIFHLRFSTCWASFSDIHGHSQVHLLLCIPIIHLFNPISYSLSSHICQFLRYAKHCMAPGHTVASTKTFLFPIPVYLANCYQWYISSKPKHNFL